MRFQVLLKHVPLKPQSWIRYPLDRFLIWNVGLQPDFSDSDCWYLQYNILSMRYDILTKVVKFELDQLAQASQILPGRVLQATNTSRSVKEPFLSPSLLLNPPSTPPTSFSTTIDHQ